MRDLRQKPSFSGRLAYVVIGPCMDGSPLARGCLSVLQLLVGAAMYPTFVCGLSSAAGHNAIRAAQVPIESSHSKCTAQLGFPDPAVSTGFVHQLLSALSNLVGDSRLVSFYVTTGSL